MEDMLSDNLLVELEFLSLGAVATGSTKLQLDAGLHNLS